MYTIFPISQQLEYADGLSKFQYKNVGACKKSSRISTKPHKNSPDGQKNKQTVKVCSNLEFNTLGWNLFAYLEPKSEVQ